MDTDPIDAQPKQPVYTSEYMRLRAAAEKLMAQAEAVKPKELAAEIEDIRKRIVAWGLTAEQLFPHDVHQLQVRRTRHARDATKRKHPPKYAWDGKLWNGTGGPRPKWVDEAIALGVTLDQMAAECERLRSEGKITHPAWNANGAG